MLSYTIVITNNGVTTNTGLILSDTLDPNTSQLGLVSVSPVAFDDSYNANANPIVLTITDGPADLFANDYPGLNPPVGGISTFGGGSLGGAVTSNTAGSSAVGANGSVRVNANGSLVFTPAVSFQGVFSFAYRLQNFVGPADGLVRITVDAPPTVTSTSPTNGVNNVNGASNITINFSENVAIAAGGMTLDCGAGAVSFTPALPISGVNTITLDPTANLPGNATCTVTVLAANVTDSDANDPPDQLDGNNNGLEGDNYSFTFDIAPTANDDSYNVTPHLTLTSASSVRANDDPTNVTITGFGNTLGTANDTLPNGTNFVTAGGAGGRVVLNADGTFSYYPDAGDTNTSATFFYTVTGGDTATVTLSLQNTELVWFVDNTPGTPVCTGTNNGTQACPEDLLADVAAVDTASDTIFVAAGSYTCGITLAASERLIGDGASSDLATLTGITPVTGSSFPTLTGTDPVLSHTSADCLTLAASNTIRGLIINANSATLLDAGILGSGVGGVTSVSEVTITTSSNGNGIILTNQSGTFTFSDGSITGSNLAGAVGIDQGTAAITFTNTTINKTGGGLIAVTNKTGGSVTFSGGSITGTGLNPVLLSGVILLQSNIGTTINFGAGFNITTSSGGGFFASSGGVVSIGGTSSAISAAGGPALAVTSTTFSGGATFATVSSSGSSTTGVNLTSVTGTLTMNGGSISGSTGTAFNVSGGSATVTYAGNITQNNAQRVVSVDGTTGGAINFTTGTVTGGASSTGVNINNASGNVSFANLTLGTSGSRMTNQAVTISGGTGTYSLGTVSIFTNNAEGIVATNVDGTLNSTLGTVNATNARAINLDGPAGLTALGMTLTSVSSSNSTTNGIFIQDTNGSFIVTGDAGSANNSSGGTIQSTTSHGISFSNVQNISFDQMNIQSTGDSGINGTSVTNFTFTNGTINNAGNASFDSAIAFNGTNSGVGNNINGTLTVMGNTFTNPFYSGLDVQSDNGTVTNANISNNTITNPGFSGVNLVGIGNASTAFNLNQATINQNNISSSGGNGIQVSIGNSNATGPGATAGSLTTALDIISITNNSVSIDSTGTQAIAVANSGGNPGSRTRTNFLIECNGKNTGGCTAPTANPLTGSSIGTVVLIGNNGYADMTGTVNNNIIDANHTPGGGGGNGIGGGNGVVGLGNAWTPDLTLTVTNNTITDVDGNGILLVGRGTSGTAKLKIAGNNVAMPINAGGSARPGIRVDAGNASSADDAICLNISGNTSAGSNGAQGIGVRKQGTNPAINDFGIQGIPQASPTTAQVQSFINTQNPSGGGTDIINGDGYVQCSSAPN